MGFRNLRRSSMSCDRSSNTYPWVLFVAHKYAFYRQSLSSGYTCLAIWKNWFLSRKFFNTTIHFEFNEISRQYRPWWKRFWVNRNTLIFLWLLPFVNEWQSPFNGLCLANHLGLWCTICPQCLSKSEGNPSLKRKIYVQASCREGTAFLSQ